MFPIIAAIVGLLMGMLASSNPIFAVFGAVTFGLIGWALTGYKVGSPKFVSPAKEVLNLPVAKWTDNDLVKALQTPNIESSLIELVKAEIIKRQKNFEAIQKDLAKPAFLENNPDAELTISEKAFIDADSGDMHAQALIGSRYLAGANGLPQDFQKAGKYFLKAAEQGHSHAAFCIAGMYDEGIGLLKNPEKARYWALKAKLLGAPDADDMLKAIDSKRNN